MRELTAQEMSDVDGEGFWSGFACGVVAVAAIVAIAAPDPFTTAAGFKLLGAVGACGKALLG